MVAPWIDPDKKKEDKDFFTFEWDDKLEERISDGIILFSSTNDAKSVQKSVQIIQEKIKNIGIKEFKNYGHFCFKDLKTEKFPELLEEVIGSS